MRTFRQNGFLVDQMVAAGGPTRSALWMQIHADVSNVPILLTAVPDGPALGSAILAAVAAGLYLDVPSAAERMVHVQACIEPDPAAHQAYRFYVDQYINTYPPLQPLIQETTRHVAR